ncbi:MAG: aspartate--tRNA ligase [Pseudomonadota bacterium]
MSRERTHTCGDLRLADEGKEVHLKGWVNRRRDLGGVVFVDLRDRYGLTQVVFRPETAPDACKTAEKLRSEFVIEVTGHVTPRPQGMRNAKLPTGEIEVIASSLEILSEARTLPFELDDKAEVSDVLRLKYRYLDLRRPALQRNLLVRHRVTQAIRRHLDGAGFVDVETPFLTKSTPEGARDYLVPSRLKPGHFYALPQSPQLFKQLLMMAGLDRYYQIVRCFRDEDLRADRQPEFTQLDMEMSFATPKAIYSLIEELMAAVFESVAGEKIETPFPRLSYADAVARYATDKPDLRWPIELRDVSSAVRESTFRVFRDAVAAGGEVRGLRLPKGNELSRSQIDGLVEKAKEFGAKGLVWIREAEGKRTSSIDKVISPEDLAAVAKVLELQPGDLALLVADQPAVARTALSSLRVHVLKKMRVPPGRKFAFVWVDEFPLFEWDNAEERYFSVHHPFTSPHTDDIPLLDQTQNLGRIRAQAYDLVLNGYEIGGGSIRIHRPELQQKIFDRLGLSREEAKRKFGFFIEALEYGTPPHGGIAFGLDRISMILCGTDAIRDVIAFPKTQNAADLMAEAPSEVDPKQLEELGLSLRRPHT